MKQKLAVGDVVAVEFLDHVEDGGDPLAFIVWGRLAKITKKHYEVVSWAYADVTTPAVETNEKRWTLVRSAVSRITKLRES